MANATEIPTAAHAEPPPHGPPVSRTDNPPMNDLNRLDMFAIEAPLLGCDYPYRMRRRLARLPANKG